MKATNSSTKPKQKFYLGSLPGNAKKGIIRTHFSKYGLVSEVNLVKHKKTKKCSGFGFITMSPYEGSGLFSSKHKIMGRIIKLEQYLSGNKLKTHTTANHKRRLFVTNLNLQVRDENLTNFFSKFGELESAYKVKVQSENRPTSYGYVTFSEKHSVERFFETFKKESFVLSKHDCEMKDGNSINLNTKWVDLSLPLDDEKKVVIRVFRYKKWIERIKDDQADVRDVMQTPSSG